jgi:hypothetical protein
VTVTPLKYDDHDSYATGKYMSIIIRYLTVTPLKYDDATGKYMSKQQFVDRAKAEGRTVGSWIIDQQVINLIIVNGAEEEGKMAGTYIVLYILSWPKRGA